MIFRLLLALLFGTVVICGASALDFQGAGPLGACVLGIVARTGWIRQDINIKVSRSRGLMDVE